MDCELGTTNVAVLRSPFSAASSLSLPRFTSEFRGLAAGSCPVGRLQRLRRLAAKLGRGKPPCSIAADKFGLDHRDLHRAAKKVPGLREAHLRAWGESWGAAFPEMWEHHLEGLRKC